MWYDWQTYFALAIAIIAAWILVRKLSSVEQSACVNCEHSNNGSQSRPQVVELVDHSKR